MVPTALAVLALAVGGLGVGYALGARHGSTAASGSQSAPSSELLPGQSDGDPFGDQFGGQLPAAPDGSGSSGTGSNDTTAQASGDQLTGLVRIVSTMEYAEGKAAGTGMVLDSDGEVVTNHHVVEGATSIRVTVMSTGETYDAKVVGTDATADVAVLRLSDASGLDTVTPDEDAVGVGDTVTAVGDGNGTVDYLSAATGQVIATDQSITTQTEGTATGESLAGLTEISSDVVSGYSGGATYDDEGEVLGMTTAASSGSNDVVGYAIPIATVLRIADDLESGVNDSAYAYGYPAFLGVGLGDGTTVGQVYDGTSAADAGIAAGDTITRIDGRSTSTAEQLRAAVAAHQPGDSVTVTWTGTDGGAHTATVTLGKGPVR